MNISAVETKNSTYFLSDMDDLQFRVECGVDIVSALHECIEHGDFQPRNYANALYGAYVYLNSLSEEMRSRIDAAYSEVRKQREASEKKAAQA